MNVFIEKMSILVELGEEININDFCDWFSTVEKNDLIVNKILCNSADKARILIAFKELNAGKPLNNRIFGAKLITTEDLEPGKILLRSKYDKDYTIKKCQIS